MAVAGRAMPEYEQITPWPAIQHAVNLMLNDPNHSLQVMKGKGWSVYRVGNQIRIDLQCTQGE